MSRLTRFVVVAAALAGCVGSAFAFDATSYVQDGLIAQWDGIENAGVGKHDSAATVWKDLKNGRAFTLNGVTVNDDRLTFAGAATSYGVLSDTDTKETFEVAGGGAGGTIEIVIKADTTSPAIALQSSATAGVLLCCEAKGMNLSNASKSNQDYLFQWGWTGDTNTLSIAYKNARAQTLLVDGVSIARNSSKDYWGTGTGTTIGTRVNKGGMHFKGSIYAIRVYNRVLTQEDAERNRTVDEARFLGVCRADIMDVRTNPSGLAVTTTPAVGLVSELEEGDEIACSAPAEYVVTAPGTRVLCTGWKLYDGSAALVSSGDTTSFDYSHPGAYRCLEWQFKTEHLIQARTSDASAGTVTVQNGYYLDTASVDVSAQAKAGYTFAGWAGDIPDALRCQSAIQLPADRPRSAIACFVSATETADHVLYVAPHGDDANDGASFSTPFATVGKAVQEANALSGTTVVRVVPGVYAVPTEVDKVTAAVVLEGISVDPEDAVLRLAAGQVRLFWLDNAAAKLKNLTLEGGSGKGSTTDAVTAPSGRGRNTYVTAGTIEHCIVRGGQLTSVNSTRVRSVQVYLTGADSLMTHCVVSNNVMTGSGSSDSGGYSTPGVLLADGARLEYSLVADNRDTSNRTRLIEAGGVTIVKGTMDHCTVVGNWAPYVGGVFIENVKNGSVTDSIIWGNRSVYNGAVTDDILATTSKQFTNSLVSPADPYAVFANVVGGDWHSVVGSDAEGLGYADDPQTASFTADNPSFVGLRTVEFSVRPVDGATAYKWDFDGDGTDDVTTDDPSATYDYATPNRYDVRLTVETAEGSVVCRKANYVFAAPTVMYVKAGNKTAAYPYDTPAKAASDIQTAIDAQRAGGTVRLAADRYDINRQVVVEKDIRVEGETGDPEDVVLAIGASADRAVHMNAGGALVTGLTCEGGGGTGYGRNAYVEKRGGSFSNCVFRNCRLASGSFNANAYAHTIYLRGPDAKITHCVITNNSSTCTGGSTTSSSHVHGVYLSLGAQLENSLVADNLDTGTRTYVHEYGTVYGNGVVRNCTIVNNKSNETGGLRLTAGSVIDTVVAGNVSTGLAGEDNIYSGSSSLADHCVTSDETPLSAKCAVGAVTAIFKDWSARDYRPIANTVLVDTGAGLEAELPQVDLAGNPRFAGAAVDIGCYELDASAFGVTLSSEATSYTVPQEIVFIAAVAGAKDGDSLRYYWDFDGDGVTDLETTTNVATHAYSAHGSVTVGVCVTNFTGTVRGTRDVRPDFLTLLPHTIYFDPAVGAASAKPYLSWATAATNLQEAVDLSIPGVTIIVRAATHVVEKTVKIEKAVRVTGESGDPDKTVFRSNGSERQFYLGGGAELVNCTLEGAAEPVVGGAVQIIGSGAMISNAIVRGVAYSKGMSSSHASYPIRLQGKYSLATHLVVTGNTSTVKGGTTASNVMNNLGVYLLDGAQIENSLFAYNVDTGVRTGSSINGGVIQGNGSVVNCTVVSNESYCGSAISLESGKIVNTVAAGNKSTIDAGSPDVKADKLGLMDHSLAGGVLEKLFKAEAAGDWRPSAASPLRDGGTAVGVDLPATDLGGNPRVIGRRVDIGCRETDEKPGLLLLVR